MNAAEHYEAAEQLAHRAEQIGKSAERIYADYEHSDDYQLSIAGILAELATAHATMAAAAATIDAAAAARAPRVLYRGG